MKFATAVSLAIAPLALAKSAHNIYPLANRRHDSRPAGKEVYEEEGYAQDTVVEEVIVLWVCPGSGAETTTVNAAQTVTVTAGAEAITQGSNTIGAYSTGTIPAGSASTYSVTVGGSAGLVYSPDTIEANVGDSVVFTFLSENHTVTQSSFATPCDRLDGGMDSGFQPNANNTVNPPPQVAMQVMSSGPLWFYCRQKGHCGKGMTFSINPTANKTQAMFQAMAIAQNGTGSDSTITGGSSSVSVAGSQSTDSSTLTATLGGAAASATLGSPSAGSTGVVAGVGSVNSDGSCSCFVQCSSGSFPAAAQGIGSFGGVGGALPMTTSAA